MGWRAPEDRKSDLLSVEAALEQAVENAGAAFLQWRSGNDDAE